jgi:hypothetical protein
MLQSIVDGLNHAEFDIPHYEPTYTDRWVQAVTFYHNLAFIQKGPNLEPSNLLTPHPRETRRFAKPAAAKRPARSGAPRSPRRIFRSVVPLPIRRVAVNAVRMLRRRAGR